MNQLNTPLSSVDPEICAALDTERQRQEQTLEMIASENFAPISVMQAQGSVATNKYAEGYPGRRLRVLTGGTDVHLVLVDLVNSELDGQQAGDRIDSVGITVNRNTVPKDPDHRW